MSTATLTPPMTLGPLSLEQRAAIVQHARGLSPSSRRTYRRLLLLAQSSPRGLTPDVLARSASQAQEHGAGA